MGRVTNYLLNDFGGGRRRLKLARVINFQKLTTIPLPAIFMLEYQLHRCCLDLFRDTEQLRTRLDHEGTGLS